MRILHLTNLFCGLVCVVAVGCADNNSQSIRGVAGEGGFAAAGGTAYTSGSGGRANVGAGGAADKAGGGGRANAGSGASTSEAGTITTGSGGTTQSGTVLPKAGNPDGSCSQSLPPEAQPADASKPTTVVGTGTAESCTYDKLASAVAKAGVITFNCGTEPVSIRVTATLELKTDTNTVIDGGNKVTLDGGSSVRILKWQAGDWMVNNNALILQHIVLANGKATGTEAIPTRPAPCSQGFNDGQGGALFMRDGVLRAIDVTFIKNEAALLGPDTGGGALYLLGVKAAYIASCSFLNNRASNAGGMGSLFANNFIYNSLFDGNEATGHGANNADSSKCSYKNNNQNEVGSGGNGGAIYNDGAEGASITICGTQIRNNHANAFGSALFYTSNDDSGSLTIRDSHFFENKQCLDWWEVQPGISMSESVYNDKNMINSVFDKPSNWSSKNDPVCAPYIAEYSD